MMLFNDAVLTTISVAVILAGLLGTLAELVVARGTARTRQHVLVTRWIGTRAARDAGTPRRTTLDHIARAGKRVRGQPSVRRVVRALLGADIRANLELLVRRAGLHGTIEPEDLFAGQVVLALGLCGMYVLTNGLSSPVNVICSAGAGLIGYYAPIALLQGRTRRRQARIWTELIGAADIIAVVVGGGATLEQALQLYCKQFSGPLAHELRVTLDEMGVGRPRGEALMALAERVNLDPLGQLIGAVLHAERFGQPLARLLREQARELKTKRRQAVQADLARAPIKMLLPLAAFLLPALLLVLLGPTILQIAQHGLM